MQTIQSDPTRDLRYYLTGTGHIFNKDHALESLERLRGMGERYCEDLAGILREAMENPREFSSPSARITMCAALLLLYEWNYPNLFDILYQLSQAEHEIGKEILLSDVVDLYPQMLIRCKSFPERLALFQAVDTDSEVKFICLESLIISALHDTTLSSQVTDLCYSLWQKKTKTPELWGRALYGSIQLGDQKRADAMLKAAKNNQLSDSERKSIVAAIKSLKESSINDFLQVSKNTGNLQLTSDIATAFASIELFESVPSFGNHAHALKVKRDLGEETPDRFFVFEVKMRHDDFSTEIRVADRLSFYQLHEAILASLEWDDDHLFAFYLDNRFHGSQAVIDGDPEAAGDFADEVLLSEAGLKEGQSIAYLFDFGDNHEFTLTVSRIESYDPSEKDHEFDYAILKRDIPPPQYEAY